MVHCTTILFTAFRIRPIRNGYAGIIFNACQIQNSVESPHENLFILPFWHVIWAFLWLFNFGLRVPKNIKNVKFSKISNALKRVKMSNFWFLIVKIMFYIHEHLYKYSKKHLCHMTHRFSTSRGVKTTILWSYFIFYPSYKRTFKNLSMKQRGSASYIDKTWWNLLNVKF